MRFEAFGLMAPLRRGVRSRLPSVANAVGFAGRAGVSPECSAPPSEDGAGGLSARRESVAALAALSTHLAEVSLELASFQANSEGAFLEMASLLEGLSTRASKLVAASVEASRGGAGEETRQASAELERDLSRLVENLRTAQASLRTTYAALSQVEEKLEALLGLEAPFARITKRLESLAICMSLEAVRLGEDRAGVEAVVGDVRRLGSQIATRLQAALERAADLGRTAASVRAATEEFSLGEARWSTEIVENARSALEGLRSLSQRMGAIGEHAGDAAKDVTANVGRLVTSLQFHDLTRQKVEHAQAGIHDVQGHLSTPEAQADPAPWLARALPLCRLQAAQIERAREHFAAALLTMGSSLDGVGEVIGCLVREVHELASGGGPGEQGLIGRVEEAVQVAADVLRAQVAREERIAVSLGEVGEAVAAMAACVQDVEGIGADVEVLAINTFVKSTRAGSEGRALGVLAREIQKLTREVGRLTALASSLLRALASESRSLTAGSETELGREAAEAEEILDRLEALLAKIGGLQQGLDGTGDRLREGAEGLQREARAAAARCRDQAAVASALDKAARQLALAAARSEEHAAELDAAQTAAFARAAESRYTMEEERAIHRASADAGSASTTGKNPAVHSDYGDNVELF